MSHRKASKRSKARNASTSGPGAVESDLKRILRREGTRGTFMDAATNLQNMKTLDDSWNAQDLQTFRKYHAKDCIVRWPNQPPTHGVDAHEQEAIAFFKTFPDQHLINNPYKIMLAQGEWTCTVADFRGTMTGPMTMPGGTVIQPTNKSFHVDFCTVARWNELGQIVEENLFYDLMGMLKQIGLIPSQEQKAA